MTIYHQIILALWLVFLAVWAISARSAKPSVDGRWSWWRAIALRLAAGVVVVLAVRLFGFGPTLRAAHIHWVNRNAALGAAGVVLSALGVGLAIWARLHLGRNWGMPMSRRQNPDLITTGPYAYVRHPIYGGILIAILGTGVGITVIWFIPSVLAAFYFVFAARREEQHLAAQFPEQYPAYRRRTKMFIPFLI